MSSEKADLVYYGESSKFYVMSEKSLIELA